MHDLSFHTSVYIPTHDMVKVAKQKLVLFVCLFMVELSMGRQTHGGEMLTCWGEEDAELWSLTQCNMVWCQSPGDA